MEINANCIPSCHLDGEELSILCNGGDEEECQPGRKRILEWKQRLGFFFTVRYLPHIASQWMVLVTIPVLYFPLLVSQQAAGISGQWASLLNIGHPYYYYHFLQLSAFLMALSIPVVPLWKKGKQGCGICYVIGKFTTWWHCGTSFLNFESNPIQLSSHAAAMPMMCVLHTVVGEQSWRLLQSKGIFFSLVLGLHCSCTSTGNWDMIGL